MSTIPVHIEVHKPSTRYIDEMLSLKCGVDLIHPKLKLFPNAKEITESFAAFRAVRDHLRDCVSFEDKNVTVIAVGDGKRPRTGATFAFRSKWNCISIDPKLHMRAYPISRLQLVADRIENCPSFFPGTVIIAAVHSHATLTGVLDSIKGIARHVIAIPCCIKQEIPGKKPDIEYRDSGIWSPENKVLIWKNV